MKIQDSQQLIELFNSLFAQSFNTVLIGGAAEPVYLPADMEYPCHRICFREDYLSSAFHEIAHWCLAGSERRKQVDFGYWYNPDGRTEAQQKVFESVEIKPQALEWHLSEAAGHRFNLSADNLNGDCGVSEQFTRAVIVQARRYCPDPEVLDHSQPMPARARLLIDALHRVFGGYQSDVASNYCRQKLVW